MLGLGKDAIEKESKITNIYWKSKIHPMDRCVIPQIELCHCHYMYPFMPLRVELNPETEIYNLFLPNLSIYGKCIPFHPEPLLQILLKIRSFQLEA